MTPLAHFVLLICFTASAGAADWQPVKVPGPLEFTGVAWLRAWVKVDDSFFTPHERNLFEESVGVNIQDLAGAHELWINGARIGGGGAFPPNYREAGHTNFRHKVPVGTLRKGEWNEVAIKMYQPAGRGGFLGDPPFIMNYFVECVFDGVWELRAGGDYEPGGALAGKPQRATFEMFRESQRVLGRTEQVHGPALPPEVSAGKIQAFDDLKVDLLLNEPLVAQPFHFSFDERGRLWVTQSRQYPYPAGVKMISRDKYYRSHYDKVPPAPPNNDRGADIISIHEDTDHDGVYDKHKVFVDGLNMANAAVRGRGGVWVMNSPYLLFYPDANNDDIPDAPPTVHLSGFGLEDSHSTANGLVWGPDGWLYGAQGSTTSCRVRRPGLDPDDSPGVYFEGCMVWRYHPETRAFEIFAEGGGNTFGLEFDREGRLYSGHNGGGTRGWHFVQGGFYLMQGVDPGKFGPPRNPYAFGELPMMATKDQVVRFTHFGAFADGTAIPSPLAGMLLAMDPLHNEIIATERKVHGSTFDTHDRGVVVKSSDSAFRPVYMANAPDGSLYVADMYEFYIAHGQHYQNQIDPTTGRIYRISGKDAMLEKGTDLSGKNTEELITLLGHPNKWHRNTAVRLLGERKDANAAAKLRGMIAEDRGIGALGALWALHQSIGVDQRTLTAALEHPYAPVRLWAARLTGDSFGIHRNLGLPPVGQQQRAVPPELFAALLAQAKRETDAEVRSQLAATARRLPDQQALALVQVLMTHSEDLSDPFIPLMCWWVFESRIPIATDAVVECFKIQELWGEPVVISHILSRLARRLAVGEKRHDSLLLANLLRLAPGKAQTAELTRGFEEAYRGRAMSNLPEELISAIAASGGASLTVRMRQGEESAIRDAVAIIRDGKAKLKDRLLYTRILGELRPAEALPSLLELALSNADAGLRKAALAALGSWDDDEVPARILPAIENLSADLRPAAFALLQSRPKWTQLLLKDLQAGRLPLGIVSNEIADTLRNHADKQVNSVALKLFPKASSATDFKAKLEQVERALKGAPGNPYDGESLFAERCATCHKLFFKGGNIGPDLTSYQRDNLGTMLISIVNPNAEIREGFQWINVETKDGRTLSGFQVERDNQAIVIRGIDGQEVTIAAAEIQGAQPVGRSIMPEGIIDGLSDQQLRDLFAYLRISQPITR